VPVHSKGRGTIFYDDLPLCMRQTILPMAFQSVEAQLGMPQDDDERGSDTHAATERCAKEDEEDEKDEEVELRMPGSFDFEDNDTGAAHAGTVDPFDAVCTLGNLWRRMQVR
jgi:hypothetical protein